MGFLLLALFPILFSFRSLLLFLLPKDIWRRRFKELNLNFSCSRLVLSPPFHRPLRLSSLVSTSPLSTRLLMEIKYHSVILHRM